MKTFQELYLAELQEAHSFETILLEALPRLEKAASDEELKRALHEHADATREQKESVEAILRRHKADPKEHVDQSMQRLVQESQKMAEMLEAGPVRDAALIASAQRIEHYEIAVYGTLAAYAKILGFEDEHQILRGILEQEKDTDDLLSELAEGIINPSALETELEAQGGR